jgi:hypothetical protein
MQWQGAVLPGELFVFGQQSGFAHTGLAGDGENGPSAMSAIG